MSDTDRQVKLLRYGELLARKTRDEVSPEEIAEMEEVRKELNLSAEEIVGEVEHLVKSNY